MAVVNVRTGEVAKEDSPGFDPGESPLLRLATRPEKGGKPYLDAEQFAAGEKLRRDFETSGLSQRVTTSYEMAGSGGGRHWQMSDNAMERLTENMLAARQRLHRALEAVGPELSGILYHVCCLAGGIEQAELHLQLPRRSAKAVLALALSRLARHYGLKHMLRHKGPSEIGQWSLADYRPEIIPAPSAGPPHRT
jgi:hypothetical protein